MTTKEARRLRLLELLRTDGTLRAIARKISPGSKYLDRYLSQIKTGTREMGDELAADFEKVYGKPKGWMDHVGSSSVEASELLHVWSQFVPEEQERIVEELRIRLRVMRDKEAIQALNMRPEARSQRHRNSS